MSISDLKQACPMCGEPVSKEAIQCENCGERLANPENSEPDQTDSLLIREFHVQSLWLCCFWFLISLWPTVFGIVQMYHWHRWMFDVFWETVFVVFGLALMFLAFACRAKKPWSPIVSLILSYLLLFICLATLNVCIIVLSAVMVIQSHSLLNAARKMRNAGIALDTPIQR